jgi:hypothetical protein
MMKNVIGQCLRRFMGVFRFSRLSRSGDSWFRVLSSRDGARVFWFAVVALLVVVLLLSLVIGGLFPKEGREEVFVGVMVGYDNVEDIVGFVDEVEEYVNLVVIGSLDVTTNYTKLTTVCDYLHSKGLYFIPFMFIVEYLEKPDFFQVAKARWGEHFLGVYVTDEPGGRQFDSDNVRIVDEAENYSDAASQYVEGYNGGLQLFFSHFEESDDVTAFTSDYLLYWFDYEAGFDVVFAEFGWNFSRQLHVALCRGAAEMQDKEWGAIVTWTYRNPPYIEDAEMLYSDLVLAYENGAKYILVFNYPTNVTDYGLLTEDHLESMRRFWDYMKDVPQPTQASKTAYVLPADYGYGFRGADDRIWGLWGPDNLSATVWNKANSLLAVYNKNLDIIYDSAELDQQQRYEKLIFWNGTTVQSD